MPKFIYWLPPAGAETNPTTRKTSRPQRLIQTPSSNQLAQDMCRTNFTTVAIAIAAAITTGNGEEVHGHDRSLGNPVAAGQAVTRSRRAEPGS